MPMCGVIIVGGQADLLEVVGALHPVGSLADLLYRRQQEADQDGDDGDDHQHLDQREAAPLDSPQELTHGCTPLVGRGGCWRTDCQSVPDGLENRPTVDSLTVT